MVPVGWALIWYVATLAGGVFRLWAETRRPALSAPLLLAVASASCILWASAPVMAWFSGSPFGDALAAILLCAGYFLVFTQRRAAPAEALIISAPYSLATLIILVSLLGAPGLWPALAAVPVIGSALLVKVLVTQVKDGELQAVADHQTDLIAELQVARDNANAASEAKSNFLAVISHELRTPMNGVLGAAQLLEAGDLKGREREFVRIIRSSGETLLGLLNDLLDVSKMEAGKLELAPVVVDADVLEGRAIGPCRAQAEARDLAFTVRRTANFPAVLVADPVRIGQVIQNLLSNAVKFTESGSITLDMDAEPTDDGRLRLILSVSDTGAGISDADRDRLFQPFNQLDNSSTRRFGGTGLGLTIARRLARMMEGDIAVSSEAGRGSTFIFTCVVEAASPSPAIAPTDGSDCAGDCLRVLVVEDHPVNRMILKAFLTGQGHVLTEAENGELALSAAATGAFDVILMDVNMPVMDGLTAIRELRSRPGPNRRTPVVILSASAREEDLAVGLAAGADAYLTKPIDFAAVSGVLAGLGSDARPIGSRLSA